MTLVLADPGEWGFSEAFRTILGEISEDPSCLTSFAIFTKGGVSCDLLERPLF